MNREKGLDRLYGRLRYPERALVLFAPATLGVMTWVGFLGRSLSTSITPRGIVDLELACSVDRVIEILGVWGLDGIEAAIVQTWVDYLFLLLYPVTLSLACWLLSRAVWTRLGRTVAGLVLLAAPLDAAENWLMLGMLDRDFEPWVPEWTAYMATAKFVLVIAAGVYLLLGGEMWLWRTDKPSDGPASLKIET